VGFLPDVVYPDLKTFIATTLGLEYNRETQSMLLYRKDAYSDAPGQWPVAEAQGYGISYMFPENSDEKVWMRIEEIPESQISDMQPLTCEYSEDGYTVTKRLKFFIRKSLTAGALKALLIEREFLANDSGLRVMKVSLGRIEKVMTDADVLLSYDGHVKIDLIPQEQAEVIAPQMLVEGAHLANESYLRGIGSPFFFLLWPDEKVSEFLTRIKETLKIEDVEFKKLRFLLAEGHPTLQREGMIRGAETIGDVMARVAKTADPKLYVVHPPEQQSSGGQKAVKIYH
jgi:hypothetical protein